MIHPNALQKQEKFQPKSSRSKQIIKVTEVMEGTKKMTQIMNQRSSSLKKNHKT